MGAVDQRGDRHTSVAEKPRHHGATAAPVEWHADVALRWSTIALLGSR